MRLLTTITATVTFLVFSEDRFRLTSLFSYDLGITLLYVKTATTTTTTATTYVTYGRCPALEKSFVVEKKLCRKKGEKKKLYLLFGRDFFF